MRVLSYGMWLSFQFSCCLGTSSTVTSPASSGNSISMWALFCSYGKFYISVFAPMRLLFWFFFLGIMWRFFEMGVCACVGIVIGLVRILCFVLSNYIFYYEILDRFLGCALIYVLLVVLLAFWKNCSLALRIWIICNFVHLIY